MEKKDKPLGEWTLKEVQSYCLGRSTMCDGCQFMGIHCSGGPTGWTLDDQSCAKDTNVADKPAKPRLAEVLGVEVEERFTFRDGEKEIPGLFIRKDGCLYDSTYQTAYAALVCDCINHPESIIRTTRLTEPELAICKAVGARWVSRNQIGTNGLHLWDKKPSGNQNFWNGGATSLATVSESLFPSVRPGDCICVEEVGE